MSSIRYKKRGNKFYVYEINQYWDKELKKPRQTTKYLGTANEKDGVYEKKGKHKISKLESAILDFGDSFVIKEIAYNIGLYQIIHDSFGELSDSIMSLVCYQITDGSAMYNCSDWSESNIANKLFPSARIKSQDISRLINILGKQEMQQLFFKNYIAKFFPEKTGLLIDSTALPSAVNSSINAFGYTPDGIKENVTCLMLVDKISKMPIYFRAIGGDISDNSTLKTTINEIKKLGLTTSYAILDAGYCSKDNLNYLCKEGIDFVTRLPKSHNIFYQLIDDVKFVESGTNATKYGERVVFIEVIETEIYGNKMIAYIVMDPYKKAKDTNIALKHSVNEKDGNNKIALLNKKIKYSGYFILLSKSKIETKEVLPTYYTRQAIEQIFGFSKSNNSLLPLRVHKEQSINGYLLLAFISLALFIVIRQRLQPDITMDKALLRLRGLKAKIYNDEILIQEPSKKVTDIVRALNIIMPTSLGI